jgi:hypothetical protein
MKKTERIEVLQAQHKEIEKKIVNAFRSYKPDHVIAYLKRKKLQIKTQIEKLKTR